MTKLLSTNYKLDKQNGTTFLVTGLSLAPHTLAGVGNVCSHATPGCKSACVLWFSGRTMMPTVRDAMRRRTQMLFSDRLAFELQLHKELARHYAKAVSQDLTPCVRLNVASDLDWSHIAEEHPGICFYDYTKVVSRLTATTWPANYELTYSVNERSDESTIANYLSAGRNVSAVFSTRYHPQSGRLDPLPQWYRFGGHDWPVIDGDQYDVRLRSLDGAGVIVGLRFKGSLKRRQLAIRNGFCLDERNGWYELTI